MNRKLMRLVRRTAYGTVIIGTLGAYIVVQAGLFVKGEPLVRLPAGQHTATITIVTSASMAYSGFIGDTILQKLYPKPIPEKPQITAKSA